MKCNEHKICFIACVNNNKYEKELVGYLNRLNIPTGYELDYISIQNASSMCAGYNEGMYASDAKYKIYLHQDTFIIYEDFLIKLVDIFQDDTIGMIGMVGSPKLPDDGIMWDGPRVGKGYYSTYYKAGIKEADSETGWDINHNLCDVEAIDGFLIATQYDIRWREDLFTKWDFYDISQSAQMLKAGYRVVVPCQDTPWCIHDDAFLNLSNYENERQIFISEYKTDRTSCEDISIIGSEGYARNEARLREQKRLSDDEYEKRTLEINTLLSDLNGININKLTAFIEDVLWFEPVRETDDYAALFLAVNIIREEFRRSSTNIAFRECASLEQIKDRLFEVRTLLYRIAFAWDDEESIKEDFIDFWRAYPSMDLLWSGISNMSPLPKLVTERIKNIFGENKLMNEKLRMLLFADIRWPGNDHILLQIADAYAGIDEIASREYLKKIPKAFWSLDSKAQYEYLDNQEKKWIWG